MRDVLRFSDEKRLGLPTRLCLEYEGGKVIDVPFDLVRNSAPVSITPPSRNTAGERDRGPTTISEAICLALFLKDCRMTSGQLIADVQERWGDRGWDDSSIGVEASRMVRAGTLQNFREDVRDGRGKGYSLVDWSPPEAANDAT